MIKMNKPKYIELLAPAGSFEALQAAVNAGADAVYLGGKSFGARQYADNFDRENLTRAVNFAHLHAVKIYVTVNTLVDDSEFAELAEYLLFLRNIFVDGIIVQDLGVVYFAQTLVPDLPLHASTQMTITNSLGVAFAKKIGLTRSVLARELSLQEIGMACTQDTEIETFIHGALCVCYSGQCLMSSLIGGRSGNRGRCAQPCRLPYTLTDKDGKKLLENAEAGQYLLSPRDLNTLDILPQLIETGVISYKIEGRMKRPEYVAVVVDCYRRAIDSYLAGNYQVSDTDKDNIRQIFNRDFTTAYLENRPGRNMMSDRRPNNRGVLIGRVTELGRGRAKIKLEKELHLGDGLEFWVTTGGRVGTVIEEMLLKGQAITEAQAGEIVELIVPKGVRLNDRVFRTLDNNLMTYAAQFYGNTKTNKIPVTAKISAYIGSPFVVTLTDKDGNVGIGETNFLVEQAQKHALTEETIYKQINRFGTSEYALTQIEYAFDVGIMVPVSEINEARRMAVEALDRKRLQKFAPARKQRFDASLRPQSLPVAPVPKQTGLSVHCDTLEKVNYALKAGADRIIFAGDAFSTKIITDEDYAKALQLTRTAGKEIAFATPKIIKENQLPLFRHLFGLWQDLQPDFVYLNNNSLLIFAKEFPRLKYWADQSLNIYNHYTLTFLAKQGLQGAGLSNELTMAQVGNLRRQSPLPVECLVQGYIEMMVSEYCVGGSFLGELHKGECKFQCGKKLFLQDRQNARFPVATDQYCRMHILNSVELSLAANVDALKKAGADWLKIDGRYYSPAEVGNYTALYRNILDVEKLVTENLPDTTRGHYFRGVL